MSTELTPEQERQVQERIEEQVNAEKAKLLKS